MQLPLQITFRNTPRTDEAEAVVRLSASKLDRFAGDIMSCRVVVDMPHRHHEKGNLYQVRIDVTLRDGEVVINREAPEHGAAEDFRVAVSDAFQAADRQLEDYVRRRRHDVKTHADTPHGRVTKLFRESGYGFLETHDGREIYFHGNSVVGGDFADLHIGDEVAFAEEEGERGPQASTVKVVGRHHHVL